MSIVPPDCRVGRLHEVRPSGSLILLPRREPIDCQVERAGHPTEDTTGSGGDSGLAARQFVVLGVKGETIRSRLTMLKQVDDREASCSRGR